MAMSTRIWNLMRGRLKSLSLIIGHLSLTAVGALLLTACTIIDNDLRGLPDTPGFKEIEHVETDQYTLDYQYQPTTIVVDEQMARFISTVDYQEEVLYMYDYTPRDLLPDEGRVLVSTIYGNVIYGLRHRVTQVSHEGSLYVIKLQEATLDEAYKHLRLDAHFETDTTDTADNAIDDMDPNDPRSLTRAGSDGQQAFTYGEWHEFSLLDKVSAMLAFAGTPLPNHVNFNTGSNVKHGIKGYADLQGDIIVAWRPIIKGHAFIDLSDRMVDMNVQVGVENKTTVSITGKIGVTIDILELFGVKEALSVKELVVPALSLWLVGGFALDFDINMQGTISKTFHRRSYITLGACNNIDGKDDGVNVDKGGGSESIEAAQQPEEWSDDAEISPTFEMSLMGGAELKLLIGNPTKWPQAGIAYSGVIGPKVTTYYSGGNSKRKYDKMLKVGVAIKPSGRFYFDLFEGITFDWDFVDALFKKLGSKNGAEVMIPALTTERRYFPDMQNMTITCQNPSSSDPPLFDMSFDVTNRGFYCDISSDVYPYIMVYEEGKNTPLLEYDPRKKVSAWGSGTSFIDHFEWNGFGDGVLQRDKDYELEVIMMSRYKYYQPKELWRERTPFIALWQPTMRFHGGFPTAQWKWMPASDEAVAAGGYEHYDWTFRTVVSFNETMQILDWGFEVAGKTFPVEGPPPTNGTSMTIPIRWKLKNSKRSSRTIKFEPYINAFNPITGFVERFDQKKFQITLEWDDNWVLKEVEDEPRTVGGIDYLVTGYDWDVDFVVPEQVNIDDNGSLRSRQQGRIVTDPDGTQVMEFTIDLDE